MKKEFLILDPHLGQGLSLARHLKYTGHKVELCNEPVSHAHSSPYLSNKVEEAFALNKCVIPTGITSTSWLLSKKPVIRFHDHEFHADSLRVSDKVWLLNVAKSINIPIPRTYHSLEEVKNNFPIFYKNKMEGAKKNVGILHQSPSDPLNYHHFLFQEIISGEDTYGVAFIAHKGQIKTYASHREVFSNPPLGGSAAIIEKYNQNRLIDYTSLLVKSINYTGWGLAEYKYCEKRDDYVLMEINPKFWASLEFTLRAYPHFSETLLGKPTVETNKEAFVYLDRLLLASRSKFIKELCRYNRNFFFCEYKSVVKRFYLKCCKPFKFLKNMFTQLFSLYPRT